MYNPMDIGTTRRMATPLYSYIRRHPKEMVYRIETAQRNCKLGIFVVEFCYHLFIWTWEYSDGCNTEVDKREYIWRTWSWNYNMLSKSE